LAIVANVVGHCSTKQQILGKAWSKD